MMRNSFLAAVLMLAAVDPAAAQGWRWGDDQPGYGRPRGPTYYYPAPPSYYRNAEPRRYVSPYRPGATSFLDQDEPRRRRVDPDDLPDNPKVLDGGGRPDIQPVGPQSIRFESRFGPGTIIIDTAGRQLLLIQAKGIALRYPISVDRDGFTWTGEEKISRIA